MANIPCFHGWKIVDPEKPIGRGHFGAVYEIEKEASGSFSTSVEHSAMKVISIPPSKGELESLQAEYGDDESVTTLLHSQVDSITGEFELMSKLKGHSNIVSFEDYIIVQQDNGMGWDILIRMELLASLPLYTKGHAMVESEVVQLGIDICKALERCEKHNILHRDIKPQNIFVNADGDFKLGDFGVARISEHMTASTVAGTYDYMAPEVYQNKKNYDKRADLYSLGLVLYWLLNEHRGPFMPLPPQKPVVSDKNAAWDRRMSGEPLPRPAHGSPALQAVVLKACAFAREDRFADAAEMRKALESLSAGEEKSAGEDKLAGEEKPTETKEPPAPEKPADIPAEEDSSGDETVDGRGKVSKKSNPAAGKLDESTISAFHRPKDETVYDAKSESQEPEPVKKESGNEEKQDDQKKRKKMLIAAACAAVVLVLAVVGLSSNKNKAESKTSASYVSSTATVASTTVPQTTEAAEVTVSEKVIPSSAALEYTTYTDYVAVTGYTGSPEEVVVPSEVNGLPVTEIAGFVFDSCISLTSITIPDGVTTIRSGAFDGCSSLTSITIPDSVTTIGHSAFEGCISLTSITIPDSVATIGEYAFYGCWSLTSITIPDSVTIIRVSAFYGCWSLTSITIPDSVTTIGRNAFRACSSLTSITVPDNVTTIGDGAFYECSSLKSASVPAQAEIADNAFPSTTTVTYR